MPAPRTPYGASLLDGRGDRRGRARRVTASVSARCGTRRSSVRTCRARSAGCCACRSCRCPRSPTRRSRCCIPTTRPTAMVAAIERRYDGPLNVVGPGAATPWQAARLGGRIPLPVAPAAVERGVARRRDRGRGDRAARGRAAAPRPHRIGRTRRRRARPRRPAIDAAGAARAVRVGRRRPDPHRPGGGRVTQPVRAPNEHDEQENDYGLDIDKVSPPEPFVQAVRRRVGGRYPTIRSASIRRLADLAAPLARAVIRVHVTGGEQRAARQWRSARRQPRLRHLRAVGARRRGRQGDRAPGARRRRAVHAVRRWCGPPARCDRRQRTRSRDCVRAGHLVAVSLAPTWLRTGAGTPPLPLDAGDDARARDSRRGESRRSVRDDGASVARTFRCARGHSSNRTNRAIRSVRHNSRKRCATRCRACSHRPSLDSP